jgi:hypothetical protein
MKTIPITGTHSSVSFFEDDTIETVRQHVALVVNSHPDRLFLEALTTLPEDYYSTNPKHWMALFFRLSYDGKVIRAKTMETYLNQTRVGTGVSPRDIEKDDWNMRPLADDLQTLFNPGASFQEWRVLGVEDGKSIAMPLPPQDLPELKPANTPLPTLGRLFENAHPYELSEIRATAVSEDASDLVMRNYFPSFVKGETPSSLGPASVLLKSSQSSIANLLALDVPNHKDVSILRAKWYIPLVSTRFGAPRSRFEQIFYGLTVSPATPYVGYFTSKQDGMRHKFYVENPKDKKPILEVAVWKAWINNTQPQRRMPTLLLYRGTSRTSFDRIAVTPKDITVSTFRSRESTESLAELQKTTSEWMHSMDALMPFVEQTDIEGGRWELNDMSVIASYASAIHEFDMRRFPCLQTVFNFQDGSFRLLRAERGVTNISPAEMTAFQVLRESDAPSAAVLEAEMGLSRSDAVALFDKLSSMEDIDEEKAARGYPILKFSNKEVVITSVTSLDRMLHYANILRFVLTSDSDSLNDVCPRRVEVVEPITVTNKLSAEEGEDLDDDLMAAFENLGVEDVPVAAAPKTRKVKVKAEGEGKTFNYFNERLRAVDPGLFDSDYPKLCEQKKQVLVLTPEKEHALPEEYAYADNEKERLQLEKGVAICPAYWCMKDEIPLRGDQMVVKEGEEHCPVCDGLVRKAKTDSSITHPVMKRDSTLKFPDFKKGKGDKRVPCCYKTPRKVTAVLAQKDEILDAYYVLSAAAIPGLRIAYLPDDLAAQIGAPTKYAKSIKDNRILLGETDFFRIGTGSPSKTLPILLGDSTKIPRPKDAKESILQCSFFRTWKTPGEGETAIDRIIDGIDRAFQSNTLGRLEEIEYVALILRCRVIRVSLSSRTVLCGFWTDMYKSTSRTIVLLDNDVLGKATRKAQSKGSHFEYVIDVNKFATDSKTILGRLHDQACSTTTPTFEDALIEIRTQKGSSDYQVILDPFGRVQAVFVPTQIVLPVLPVNREVDTTVVVRGGYNEILTEELPTRETVSEFLANVRHPGFKHKEDVYDVEGRLVEVELTSGFRIPFQPVQVEGEKHVAREVVETIRTHGEAMLVEGEINAADRKRAEEISYSAEVYEFLMFSLSKDIQTTEYASLRKEVETSSNQLYKRLDAWLKKESIWSDVSEPSTFVNKVRTPCGQFAKKDACNKSSLCGWSGKTCKIKVKPIVDRTQILKRMATTLTSNEKQRALVLDERMSPFFSTILYLEMPHELIVTRI